MSILFFDTETTGKWNFKAPTDDPNQPHLVQLAVIVDNLQGETTDEYSVIVQIGEAEMEEGAFRTHGISKEKANKEGLPLGTAVQNFHEYSKKANRIVCHNTDFDIRVMRAAFHRANSDPFFKSIPKYCTMKTSTDVLKLPGPYGYKWPTLDEAYRVLVNPEGFEGAHDALVDVKACREVYYALRKMNK